MLYLVRAVLVALHPIAVFAANDWSRPCVTGTCSHDSGDGKSTAFSSLILNGPETSLSDITSAAGWQISGCDPAWSRGAHKVEITCSGNPAQARHCEHVLKGGAVDKIVRLPQNCGTGPFARVVAWTKPALNEKRAGHTVHVVELDYDFKRPSSKSKAPITFVATASNVPTNSTARSAPRIQSRNRKRLPVVEPRFSKSGSSNAPPINLSKTFTLLDESFECPANGGIGVDAHLKADLDVGVDAQVAFGYTVSGSIFPPKIKHLALTSTLSGDAFAEFNVDASVTGTFDTGSVQLFSQDLPHLSISGIITLGPQFIINGQLSADLGVQASLKTGAKWTFPTVSLVFPPSQGQSVAQAVAAQTPLDVYINPTAEVNGQLTGHIVPKVLFGINVLDGLAEADVYLDADVSATLGLQVTTTGAAASGCVTLDGGIDIAAGADGSIKGIFDKNLKFDIYNTEVSLFKNCFGNPASAAVKRSRSSSQTVARISGVEAPSPEGSTTTTDRLRPRLTMHTRDIICPGPEDGGQLVQVASQ